MERTDRERLIRALTDAGVCHESTQWVENSPETSLEGLWGTCERPGWCALAVAALAPTERERWEGLYYLLPLLRAELSIAPAAFPRKQADILLSILEACLHTGKIPEMLQLALMRYISDSPTISDYSNIPVLKLHTLFREFGHACAAGTALKAVAHLGQVVACLCRLRALRDDSLLEEAVRKVNAEIRKAYPPDYLRLLLS